MEPRSTCWCACFSTLILIAGFLLVSTSSEDIRIDEQSDDPRRPSPRVREIGRSAKAASVGVLRRREGRRLLANPPVQTGEYSRTYFEKNFGRNRGPEQEESVTQTIAQKTHVTFHRTAQGPSGPIGSHVLSVRNQTLVSPSGLNLSSEFSNVTIFSGKDGVAGRSRQENVHPLTQYTNLLFDYRAKDRGGGYIATRPHPCDQRSCYPATGNLLIGREANLTASSTCGIRGEERYCIVSHLEDKKKCFKCDSRDRHVTNPGLSHRIDNILHRFYPGMNERRSWWQSENGMEEVSVRLDLEAEFHFTHMIITFKTFRPAAMLIERSFDFGRTWKVYRYFAYDCKESFPDVPVGPFKSISDVICESRYSSVAPSTEGEVIFRVLPKGVEIPDPYAQDVQNLLKMTNLRINFTKLHTLGDDLLDRRQEIQEKYYYAIYEMVVRGSCSCYGHASRCLPGLPTADNPYVNVDPRPDMVHGRCECTHNTKGLNCEMCEDFHYDLPWKPAFGKQSNACKRCNCNNHGSTCHFDNAVYAASGNISGGVCTNCQDNTMGAKCEKCKPFFYHHPDRDITALDACQRCDCDPRGSLDDGICDSMTDVDENTVAGRCHCKLYASGQRCDHCAAGYWELDANNPEGCKPCTCNLLGTVGNQGCDMATGECTCKRYVTGRDCNQCLPEYWGLSEDRDGCKPCECDVGGAYDNNCDVFTGECRCRQHVTGRNCSTPEERYFAANLDYLMYEAELATNSPNCQVIVREPYRDGRDATWTGVGFVRAFDDSYLEFLIQNIVTSMEYDLVIRYEPQQAGWHQVKVVVLPDTLPDPDGPCANNIASNAPTTVLLRTDEREARMYPPLCLENGTRTYKIRLEVQSADRGPASSVLIDSIVLIPKTDGLPFFHRNRLDEYRKQQYDHYRCGVTAQSVSKYEEREECKKMLYSVGYYVFDGAFECGCHPTGSTSTICETLGGQCTCRPNVVGRTCDRCAPGTYGFGPEGCRPCECNPVGSLDNFCDATSGQCRCKPNTYGLQCNQCQPGYWNFSNCKQCNCNGHADICESSSGTCIECRDHTTGSTCDRCVEGYYGDPRIGVDIACRPCPCPGTAESGDSFASRCALDRITNDVICECQEGYAGPRCDICADNFFGSPEISGGNCTACSCNNNIDISRPGNCDLRTGECLQCLFNTEGFNCADCKSGFYGDAINQMCRPCVCNILGTDASISACNRVNGQCTCLPNVIGISCDQCKEDHWKIASGEGCEACNCDPVGSQSTQCNLYDGQCSCKDGFGGRRCDQCEANFWGDPALECYPCECNRRGSATMQCDRTNGSCVCVPGMGGNKCDECARGYIGDAPACSPCGECFENWDRIVGELKAKTTTVVEAASQIKHQGTQGAYSKEFNSMQDRIDEVKRLLKSSSISSLDLEELQTMIDDRKANFANTSLGLDAIGEELATVSQKVLLTNVSLAELERKVDSLQTSANSLKDKAINLQEANVEGALNLTRDAKRKSDDAVRRADEVQRLLKASSTQRQRVETLHSQIAQQQSRNLGELRDSLGRMESTLNDIDRYFPELNTLVCDKAGSPCDPYCGGAGCGKCGGISCEGAVTNAEQALKYAQDAHTELKAKDAKAEELLRSVTQAKKEVDEAKALAQMAFDQAEQTQNKTEMAKRTLEGLESEIQEFLNHTLATPVDIQTLAQEVLRQSITLQPQQIDQLSEGIRQSITRLKNIEEILHATVADLGDAEGMKRRAVASATEASKVLQEAIQVRAELEDASEAQRNAEMANEKAKEDIAGADIDLKQIRSETADADKKSQDAAKDVDGLKIRLEELQKKNVQNDRKRNQAKQESESASKNATAVQENAQKLKEEYLVVSQSLENKLKRSEGAKGKDEIQNRANRLANNVKEKQKELTDIESEYNEHEKRSDFLSKEIERLGAQMQQHLEAIRRLEEYHSNCNS